MISILSFLFLGVPGIQGIIDRVEGDWAVVEWSRERLSDLPVTWLPDEPNEGDRLNIRFLPWPFGEWKWDCPSDPVWGPDIPVPEGILPGRRYLAVFHLDPGPEAPPPTPSLGPIVLDLYDPSLVQRGSNR